MVLLAGVLTSMGTARRARAQISPGPLSRAHQSLEGPLNCLKCHAGKAEALEKACLECHKPIATLQALKRGLHATIREQKCATCHPEHAGRDFSLITGMAARRRSSITRAPVSRWTASTPRPPAGSATSRPCRRPRS